MPLQPVPMDAVELVDVLKQIAAVVMARDSFGGSIEYDGLGGPPCTACRAGADPVNAVVCDHCEGMGDEPLPEGKDFWVHGVYRVGNSQGQGGVRMIGEPVSNQGRAVVVPYDALVRLVEEARSGTEVVIQDRCVGDEGKRVRAELDAVIAALHVPGLAEE